MDGFKSDRFVMFQSHLGPISRKKKQWNKTGKQVITGGEGSQEQVYSLRETPAGLGSWSHMCLIDVGLQKIAEALVSTGLCCQEGVRWPADGVGEGTDRGSGLHINYLDISAKDDVSGSLVCWQVMQLVSSLCDVEPNLTNSVFVSIYIAVNCILYLTTAWSIKPFFLYIAFALCQFASELCTGCTDFLETTKLSELSFKWLFVAEW